jgi:hypothetical protein
MVRVGISRNTTIASKDKNQREQISKKSPLVELSKHPLQLFQKTSESE